MMISYFLPKLCPFGAFIVFLVIVWVVMAKMIALWFAARRNDGWWFIALFFLNTLGILELIYFFGVAKLKPSQIIDKKSTKKKK